MDNLFRKVFYNLVIRNKIFYFLKIINENYKKIFIDQGDLINLLIHRYKGIEFFKEFVILSKGYKSLTLKKGMFPSYLTFDVLDLRNYYTLELKFENGSIPNSVTDLKLPMNFNEKLLNDDGNGCGGSGNCNGGSGSCSGSGSISGIYPNNLKRLFLSYYAWGEDSFFCSKYNRFKMKSHISPPQTLEYLKFQYSGFPFKECEFKIPKFTSIHTLVLSTYSIGGSKSGTIKADILPPSLTELVLDCEFKYIENNVFSKTKIKKLVFSKRFDGSLVINKTQLPSTLEILKFHGKIFSHDKIENDSKLKIFETDSLPNGLKKFIVSDYPGFNQNIQVNNFFPISCTYIYLKNFKRPITTKLKDGTVVSIFPENLKELVFFELMLNQPLLLLPNSITTLRIISHQGRGPSQFYQPLIKFNCLPLYLITLVLDYHYYYLDIINGVIEKIKWLPTTLKNLTFNTFGIKTFRFLGNLSYYKSQFNQNFSNCPFDNFNIISSLKYLQISDVYYID
ncbi:hypothetical protein ACTFIW_002470 [Dictyostelium discoideum]